MKIKIHPGGFQIAQLTCTKCINYPQYISVIKGTSRNIENTQNCPFCQGAGVRTFIDVIIFPVSHQCSLYQPKTRGIWKGGVRACIWWNPKTNRCRQFTNHCNKTSRISDSLENGIHVDLEFVNRTGRTRKFTIGYKEIVSGKIEWCVPFEVESHDIVNISYAGPEQIFRWISQQAEKLSDGTFYYLRLEV